MRSKIKYFMCFLCAMVVCCSVALAATANASSRRYGEVYQLTVNGSYSSITCIGEHDIAWSRAVNNTNSTYYVKSLTTKSFYGSSEVSSSFNYGSISPNSRMEGASVTRLWENANYKYVHNLKITNNYNNQIMKDDLTMTVIQN